MAGDADQARLAAKYIKCEGNPYIPDTVTICGEVYIREDLVTINHKEG